MSEMTHRDRELDDKEQALRQDGMLNPHPDRVTDPLFAELEFFDPRDIMQVKYEMLRRVEQDGESVTGAAAAFGVSRPTYYEARKAFDRNGLHGLVSRKRGPKRAHKLTDEVLAFVDSVVAASDATRSAELAEQIHERFGLTVHPRSIDRALARRKKGGS
jgi:transposase